MRTRPESIPFAKHPLSKIQPKQSLKRPPPQEDVQAANSETDEEPRTKTHKAEMDDIKTLRVVQRFFKNSPGAMQSIYNLILEDEKKGLSKS